MSSRLRDITLFSGNTILGDGSVIMIIDPNGIAAALGVGAGAGAVAERQEAERHEAERREAERQEAERHVPLLIFRAGSTEPKAVPLRSRHPPRGDRGWTRSSSPTGATSPSIAAS